MKRPNPISLEAAHRILSRLPATPVAARLPLRKSLGCVLADDVRSDMNMPPFAKAMMDGYAVVASDVRNTPATLRIIGEVSAGRVSKRRVTPGTCTRIMTGAPVPAGADAVVRVEDTSETGNRVRIDVGVPRGRNVARKAEDIRTGALVLKKGTVLRAAEIGILAAVGQAKPRVFRRPTCAVIATGDELIAPDRKPKPGQIRNSNGYSIHAQLEEIGMAPTNLGVARDRKGHLQAKIRKGLKHDLLLMSGGVSAGRKDFVIPVLESSGVSRALYQVMVKPGKPLYVGTKGRHTVFALPGNPVATLVLFEIFVKPFLRRMMGRPAEDRSGRARLARPVKKALPRVQYLPAVIEGGSATPLSWSGSADLFALTKANGFVIVPVGKAPKKGAVVETHLL